MRTVVATTSSNKSTNLAAAKCGRGAPAAPKRERASDNSPSSSFDEVLQQRRAPKNDEPKRAEPPTNPARAKKTSAAASSKSRAKKPAADADPARTSETSANQATPKDSKPATVDDPTSDEQTSAAAIEQVQPDEQDDDGDPDATGEQAVDTNIAATVPAEKLVDPATKTGDAEAQTDTPDVQQIDARSVAKQPTVVGNATKTDEASEADARVAEAPDVDVNEGDLAAAAPQLKRAATREEAAASEQSQRSPLDTIKDVGDLDTLVRDVTDADAPKTAQPADVPRSPNRTAAAAADPLGAKPAATPATKSGSEQRSADHQQNFAGNPGLASIAGQPASDESTSDFEFYAANSADVNAVDPVSGQTDAAMLGVAKLDVPQTPQTQTIAQAQPAPAPAPAPAPPPERVFAADNHSNIVTSVRTNLLPNGGTMQITLNPPELGAIQVAVQMRDGVMNASFETSSDQATRLLSHSLGELRTSLENSGIAIDKLHVEQAPKNQQSQNQTNDERQQQGQSSQDSSARREQERRELLARMWRRLSEGSDPLDMVA